MDNSIVGEWIRFAQMDYDHVLKTVETHYPIPIEIVCYHCQQSVEKILKAFIIMKDGSLTKTHDLDVLLEQCIQYSSDFDRFAAACEKLSTYAAQTRYPSDIELTEAEMRQAIKETSLILDFTKSKLTKTDSNT
jgi:HEPN domain-containing protein